MPYDERQTIPDPEGATDDARPQTGDEQCPAPKGQRSLAPGVSPGNRRPTIRRSPEGATTIP
ncbi:MAG: hypothetical protein JSV78_15015, partial [Phycisphaerales bacterium]